MSDESILLLMADAVLALHLAFVVFVLAGLLLILAGGVLGWAWVRNRTFRISHLVAIVVVVLQAWLGMICPLTHLEMWLRVQAGEAVYSGTFVSHWMQALLYYEAPMWVFALCYTAFGLLVLASWFWVRPFRAK